MFIFSNNMTVRSQYDINAAEKVCLLHAFALIVD